MRGRGRGWWEVGWGWRGGLSQEGIIESYFVWKRPVTHFGNSNKTPASECLGVYNTYIKVYKDWRQEEKGTGDDKGWNGWMALPTWWTWVWANEMVKDREAWCAAVPEVAKNRTQLSNWKTSSLLFSPVSLDKEAKAEVTWFVHEHSASKRQSQDLSPTVWLLSWHYLYHSVAAGKSEKPQDWVNKGKSNSCTHFLIC